MQGPGKHTTSDGNVITGEFYNSLPDGPMKIQYKNGIKYIDEKKKREVNF